ncbi:hypothetical protein [Sphingomonas faeni]|uniref:hypothetical protein n=1 Tax=Sphingomonas faeni TaxID=185950 RepID=UPI0027870B3A|nr:hypothetical protein [Sphingomonas faeni]MDQ0839366.1 hypothetical protein [Sphingomonas faeni]
MDTFMLLSSGSAPASLSRRHATLTSVTSATWNQDDYPREGDPHDRLMVTSTLRQPMVELAGATSAVPFVASNDISAYSVLDTGTGTISSYAFDTRWHRGVWIACRLITASMTVAAMPARAEPAHACAVSGHSVDEAGLVRIGGILQ